MALDSPAQWCWHRVLADTLVVVERWNIYILLP
jgi:hypothetical protein